MNNDTIIIRRPSRYMGISVVEDPTVAPGTVELHPLPADPDYDKALRRGTDALQGRASNLYARETLRVLEKQLAFIDRMPPPPKYPPLRYYWWRQQWHRLCWKIRCAREWLGEKIAGRSFNDDY